MCVNANKSQLAKEIIKDTKELIDISKEKKLVANLIEYEFVRQQGKYNMLDEKARKLIGLSKKDYIYIIEHYEELIKEYPEVKKQVKLRLEYIRLADIAKIIAIKGCNKCIEKVCSKLDVDINNLCEKCRKVVQQYISQ